MKTILLVIALVAKADAPKAGLQEAEAARMRGDAEEEQRLTAMLEEAVDEALEVEGTEP